MPEPIADAAASNGEEVVIEIDPNADAAAAIAQAKALEEQNKRLFERAKKAEGFVKQSDGTWVKKTVAAPHAPITNKGDDSKPYNILEDEVADLILDGYTKEDVRFIMANGGRKSLEDANSYVSTAIKVKKEQRVAEHAAQQTSDKAGQSEVERKYTPEQLRKMTSKELEKILPHAS